MEQKTIEFLSKTYVKGKTKNPIIRIATQIFFGLFILLLLFQIWMEGFEFALISKYALPLVLFLYVMGTTKEVGGYKSTPVKVNFNEDNIEVIYERIDRDDKMGVRREATKIEFKNITKVEYSNSLRCLNLQGYPLEKVVYEKQNPKKEYVKDYLNENKEKRTLVYVDGKEKDEIINKLKIEFNIQTSFLE